MNLFNYIFEFFLIFAVSILQCDAIAVIELALSLKSVITHYFLCLWLFQFALDVDKIVELVVLKAAF